MEMDRIMTLYAYIPGDSEEERNKYVAEMKRHMESELGKPLYTGARMYNIDDIKAIHTYVPPTGTLYYTVCPRLYNHMNDPVMVVYGYNRYNEDMVKRAFENALTTVRSKFYDEYINEIRQERNRSGNKSSMTTALCVGVFAIASLTFSTWIAVIAGIVAFVLFLKSRDYNDESNKYDEKMRKIEEIKRTKPEVFVI